MSHLDFTQLCTRGRIHIFKYLEIEAIREDRKRGVLEGDCRRLPRKPSTLPDARFASSDPRRKRFTVDSGYATGDGSEPRWSQESHVDLNGHGHGHHQPAATETPPPLASNQQFHAANISNGNEDGVDNKVKKINQ